MKKELSYYETLKMIDEAKTIFEHQLEKRLNILKVPCPLFVKDTSGLQDDLTGIEEAVSFMKGDTKYEIVQSLAKWKRYALGKYEFKKDEGIYTDMKAIRKDEKVDNIHSLLVEQWDWKKVIDKEDRTISYLKETVAKIYKSIRQTIIIMQKKYPFLDNSLPKKIFFITSQELEKLYPNESPKIRERLITKDKKAVFIIGIGDKLKKGIHDYRSPDYDDWKLNGDLLLYSKVLDREIEITSMGIRVDEESLLYQLKKTGCEKKSKLPYHQLVLQKKLPYTIGGGIGESRLFMYILGKKHISEVQGIM